MGVKPEFAASHPAEGFEREYDTLVLELRPPLSQLQTKAAQSEPPRSPAELVREMLMLLHALSCCEGFALSENPVFWSEALPQRMASVDALPVANVRFLLIVLNWNSYATGEKTANVADFKACVLALFTIPSSCLLSRKGEKLLATMRAHQASAADPARPIQCTVSIRFARTVIATKALVEAVIASASVFASPLPPVQTEFAWYGVRLAGRRTGVYNHHGLVSLPNLQLLRRLCTSLLTTLSFDFKFTRSHQHRRATTRAPTEQTIHAPLIAFVAHAIGVRRTELADRLTVLDLTYNSSESWVPTAHDFASLCTLLPHSRTLQTLRVAFSTVSDLLWLAYAAMHPLTPTTQWRALHLDSQGYEPVAWPPLVQLTAPFSQLMTQMPLV